MRVRAWRYRGPLLVAALLLVLSLLPLHEEPGPARAQEREQVQDRAEKQGDLERALRNGGISTNRLIVVYAQAVPPDHPDRLRARQRAGGRLLLADVALQQDLIRLAGDDAVAAAAEIRAYPGVLDALPDSVVRADLLTNDPRLGEAYGLARIRAPAAWDIAQGHGAAVAVVDSGIHTGHPDLAGKVDQEENFSPSPTLDDLSDHGTRVAGTIAAAANNGVGAAGVAPGATLLNVKVLGDSGTGFSSDVNRGIKWAAERGARVINLSLSSASGCGTDRQQAVDYAWHQGAVVIASAGNGASAGATSPASCRNAIAVAATDANDATAAFSNYGDGVDLAAPGVDILAPVNPRLNGGAEYALGSGTSLAAAHVSGAAALIWSTRYGTAPAAVRERLFNGADEIGGSRSLWARGRVNAAGSVAGASAAQAPTSTPIPTDGGPTATPLPRPPFDPSAEQEEPPEEELQAAVSAICPSRFTVNASGSALKLAYCTDSGRSLDTPNEAISRAVVVIHGSSRNADDYYSYVRNSAAAIGVAGNTLVVAPQYLYEEDINAFKTASQPLSDLLYWDGGWREGENSRDTAKNDRPATISSFAAADQIIDRLADRNYFPNLQNIVVAGHSAGGQFTNRFVAASGAEPAGVTRRYVPMNPSSWLYFNKERRDGNTLDQFAIPTSAEQQDCSMFNNYKFGLDNLAPYPYVATVGIERLKDRFASRNIAYLLGERDNANTNSLDTGCEAELQGDYRLDRGNRYYNFVGHFFGSSVYDRHVKEIVPGVAHDGNAMINSAAGRRYLFDHGLAGTPTLTPTGTLTPTPAMTLTASPTPTVSSTPTGTLAPIATATITPPTPTSTATRSVILTAPTGLTATAVSPGQIDLVWSDNSASEDGLEIERSTDGRTFQSIGTVGTNVETYSDMGLAGNTWYRYRVRAFSAAGPSAYSNTAREKTPR